AHLRLVLGTLVHTGNACAMAAVVVQDRFYVVGLHAKLAKLSSSSPTEVVDAPRRNAQALVKLLLGATPVAIATALAENEVGRVQSRQSLKDRWSLGREWHFMLTTILGARCWKHDQLARKVSLPPLKPADLLPALACEQEQADDVCEATIARTVP